MKSKIIAIFILVAAIILMTLVPVQTREERCGSGRRFSLIMGQYGSFEEASIIPAPFSYGCPQYEHEKIPNRLYIL